MATSLLFGILRLQKLDILNRIGAGCSSMLLSATKIDKKRACINSRLLTTSFSLSLRYPHRSTSKNSACNALCSSARSMFLKHWKKNTYVRLWLFCTRSCYKTPPQLIIIFLLIMCLKRLVKVDPCVRRVLCLKALLFTHVSVSVL
jgi:hypothetical protein